MTETKINVDEIVDKAMTNLVLNFGYFADLLIRIGYQVVDSNVPACGYTDGKGITINAKMIREFNENPSVEDNEGKIYNRYITHKEMQFILCHELMHIIGLTFEREKHVGLHRGDLSDENIRKFELWNMATDYEINSLLHNNETTDDTFGDKKRNPIGNMPDWVLYESKYKDMIAEDIYQDLIKEEKQNNGGNLLKPQFGGDTSSGNGKGGMIPIDIHLPLEDQDAINEFKSRIAEIQKYGSRSNGTGESALDRAIERAFKPQPFNWRQALSKYMRKFVKANYTWNKPSRAGIANHIILPSAGTTPKLHIGVAIDTSGSITEKEINTMMNHLYTILSQFKHFEIDVWACGSKVYKETLLKLTNSNKSDIKKFVPKSDGGNDMRENFKFIRDHYKGKEKIDLMIIMSDFYDPLDGDEETTSTCPTIFMCIDHKDFKKPSKISGAVYPFEVDNENK
ncbi:MAG: hypothetical protein IJ880_13880 [Bacilli bacterium]|nr:hypothetical protein [Bacilli bacterium]